jgi:long-chain fatty acid transport protein
MVLKRSLLAASVAATLFTAGAAHATNGYFSHGFGVKDMGLGGAGVALPQSAMTIATNPAGIMDVGNRFDFDVSWFSPKRGYDATVMGNHISADSGSNNFYIPEMAFTYALNDSNSVGLAVYGNGGLNTDYSGTAASLFSTQPIGAFSAGPAGVNLEQLFVAPTYAHSFMDGKLSLGASIIFAHQKFRAKGLGAFAANSSDAANLTSNEYAKSNGWGGKIGALWHANDIVTLGASYQSKISMGKFDKYAGLFAEGGKFDIPSTWTVGGAFHVAPDWILTTDFERINYSEVASISNPGTNRAPLGSAGGPGFGWKNINIVKLGAQWQATSNLQLRAGYNHGQNPIEGRDVLFNTLAPGVMTSHYTAGFTYAIDKHQEISGAVMYAPKVSVTGTLYSPTGVAYGSETIHMKEYEATAGYAYKF